MKKRNLKKLEIKSNLKKDFIWNLLGSSIHAFNSLFFLIIVTRTNGIDTAGYFSYGFTISNIFLTVATFGGRGYQITDIKNEFSSNTYKSFRYFTTIITLVLSILFFLLFNYSFAKYITIILLIIVRVFESISDAYFGILQKNNKLYKVGKSLFFKNVLSLIVFLVAELVFKNLFIAIISWALINLIFLIFIDIKNVEKEKVLEKTKKDNNYKEIIKRTFFFFAFNFLSIFVINVPRYFIDFKLNDGLQGIYGILTMPATMVVLLTSFILQPYATRLAEDFKNKDKYKKEIKKIFLSIIIISLVCIALAYFLGIPVLNLIYGIDLNGYKYQLVVVMLGASFFAINSLLGLIYTIRRDTKYQFIVYLVSLFASSIMSYLLITKYMFWGGIISYAGTMMIIFILYLLKLSNKKNQ